MINQSIQWRKAKLVKSPFRVGCHVVRLFICWTGILSNIKYMAMNEREFKINVILSPPLLRQLTRRVWAIVSISLWPPLSFMLSHMLPDAMLYCENCEKQYREHPCGRNLALKWMKRLCESPDGKKPASQNPPTKKHLVPSLRHPDVTSIFPLLGVGPSYKS